MTPFQFVMLCAATWYIAFVVTSSSGPFNVFVWVRAHLPLGGLTACIICLSVWVGLVGCLIIGANPLYCFAVAGGSILLHGFTGWRVNY